MSRAAPIPPSAARIEAWRGVSRVLGVLVLALAFLVIAGWAVGSDVLKGALRGLLPMKANTAVGFVVFGTWLGFLWRGEKSTRPLGVLCWGCGLFTAFLGLLTLAEYFSGGDFGIDQFIFGAAPPISEAMLSARMAPASALNFLLLGGAVLLVQKQSARMFSAAQTAALLALLISLCALIGYGYGVKELYRTAPFAPMALNTAITFILAAAAFLLGTAKLGWMTATAAETSGGWLLRRLVPVTLIVATSLGWIALRGEA